LNDFKEKAQAHWGYTEQIILLSLPEDMRTHFEKNYIPLMKYLYIQAMCHGWKHGVEENPS